MMKKIFIYTLCLFSFAVSAKQTNESVEQNIITSYFDEMKNEYSGDPNSAYYYRILLRSYADGSSLIQDFYVTPKQANSSTKIKYSDPYKVLDSLKEIYENFLIAPSEGKKVIWTQDGNKIQE